MVMSSAANMPMGKKLYEGEGLKNWISTPAAATLCFFLQQIFTRRQSVSSVLRHAGFIYYVNDSPLHSMKAANVLSHCRRGCIFLVTCPQKFLTSKILVKCRIYTRT
jgi:hypothetical protein